MPTANNPFHDAFPIDGKLYRIYWGGELIRPLAHDSTERVRIWLQEVDPNGNAIAAKAPLHQVTESIGAIPKLAIGSFWKDGYLKRPPPGQCRRKETLELIAPATWNLVKAIDRIDSKGATHRWINQFDLTLSFENDVGEKVHGFNAFVVSMKTTDGREVLIPAYEIFRAFFGTTTDLCHALLNKTWNGASGQFILSGSESANAEGLHWSIDLAPGVPTSAVPYLSWLHFDKTARNAANRIYAACVRQGDSAWISAEPPIVGQNFKIVAKTIPLKSRNAILVTEICSINFPLKVAELNYTIAETRIPVIDKIDGEPLPHEFAIAKKRPKSISKPRDARQTKHAIKLPAPAMKLVGLPALTRTSRSVVHVPISARNPSKELLPLPQVSVGKATTTGTCPRAQFTPDEEIKVEELLEDRFQAINDLVEELISSNHIDSADYYPIIRPYPSDCPIYCEFPNVPVDGKSSSWASIRSPKLRPRVALVLELTVGDRLIYWIDAETPNPQKGNCALVVEMVDGSSLDEVNLESLLDTCARKAGVWPTTLGFGIGTLISTRAVHKRIKDTQRYSVNTMLNHFDKLARAKEALRHGTGGGAEIELAAPL